MLTQTPIGENRFKQLVKKVGGPGEGGADAEDCEGGVASRRT